LVILGQTVRALLRRSASRSAFRGHHRNWHGSIRHL